MTADPPASFTRFNAGSAIAFVPLAAPVPAAAGVVAAADDGAPGDVVEVPDDVEDG